MKYVTNNYEGLNLFSFKKKCFCVRHNISGPSAYFSTVIDPTFNLITVTNSDKCLTNHIEDRLLFIDWFYFAWKGSWQYNTKDVMRVSVSYWSSDSGK